jgi:hypothetical protein
MGKHAHITIGISLSLILLPSGLSVAQSSPPSGQEISRAENAVPGLHDFDFLFGHWQVHHCKLKERLVNSHEWIEFEGTLFSPPLMGGCANVDDDVFEIPGGTYRGVAPRSFDAKSQQWSIWWMDSRTPLARLDPPVRGRFQNGIGAFYADDVENGKFLPSSARPILIAFVPLCVAGLLVDSTGQLFGLLDHEFRQLCTTDRRFTENHGLHRFV